MMSKLLRVATFIASLFPLLCRAFISKPPHYGEGGASAFSFISGIRLKIQTPSRESFP
jgi:hypothetical protein